MVNLRKQKIKSSIYLFCIIVSIILIYIKLKSPLIKIMKTEDELNTKQMIEIKPKLAYKGEVEVYKKTKEEKEFTKILNDKNKEIANDEILIDMPDKASPENVKNIETLVVDDYIIISFEQAKDLGTEYEYYVKMEDDKNQISSEIVKNISKSGIKGYNYIIDNLEETKAGYEINKNNSEPILFNKIKWDKDYYLHIRAIDGNGNYSDNLTYKIELPSNGIRMQYIDINTNSEISPEESIVGKINEEYNVKEYNKNIENYTLVEIEGEEQSKLKKEKINIKYKYAKNSTIKISYYDSITNTKISDDEYINGYEGKEYNVQIKNIPGYKYSNTKGILKGKMIEGIQEIKIYYNKISHINIKYVDILTKQKIIPDEKITDIIGSEYRIGDKEISGYELEKVDGQKEGTILDEEINITFYYKEKASIVVKHVDIDTNEILLKEEIDGYVGDNIKISSKEFEGYILNENYEKYQKSKNNKLEIKEENNPKHEPSKTSNKEKKNIKEELEEEFFITDKKTTNIIDELLTEENFDIKKENISENNYIETIQSYDIVLKCNNDEYIIYYKKK